MLDSDDTELGDIRDERYVRELFARRAPHVVFHAAALKHLPLLESAPGEAVKTNVWGTQHVLAAAVEAGVERFVNVSTDKAANPCSVLGYSKRLAEGLTATASRDAAGLFMSVRFGNVLGSRGSVLTTFTAQIAGGGPITVTDPRVTRYFMTIREAVQLVIQAGAIGVAGRRDGPGHGGADRDPRRGAAADLPLRQARRRWCSPGCATARRCTRSSSATASSTYGRSTR